MTSAGWRECTSILVDNPALGGPARAGGNWDGAVRAVYAHQLESGWLPPRRVVTSGQLAAFVDFLKMRLAEIRARAKK